MTTQGVVDGAQTAVLHVIAGGLTLTSLSYLIGMVPGTIGILSGAMGIIAYGLQAWKTWYELKYHMKKPPSNPESPWSTKGPNQA